MNASVKLGGFAVAAALVFGGAYGIGQLAGPTGAAPGAAHGGGHGGNSAADQGDGDVDVEHPRPADVLGDRAAEEHSAVPPAGAAAP